MADDGVYAEEVSVEEKKAIVEKFLLDAPPAQFDAVLQDVRALVDDDEITTAVADVACPKHATQQSLIVELPDGAGKGIVCEASSVGDSKYIAPSHGVVFAFDSKKHNVENVEPLGDEHRNTDLEEFRASVGKAINEYVANHFEHGAGEAFANAGSDKITIVISSTGSSAKNFWSGRWSSTWTVSVDSAKTGAAVEGTIRLHAHYYEEGNVQLTSSLTHSGNVSFSSAVEFGAAVTKFIQDKESENHVAMEEHYKKLSDTSFKDLRRALPVYGSKFDWEKMAIHKLAGELTNAK